MFGNYFKQLGYFDKLRNLEKDLKVKDMNQSECKKCSYCCWMKPCNLSTEDFEKMANHFGISKKELFKKYLVVDDAQAKHGEYTVTPIRKEWQKYAGTYLPSHATFDIDTPCVFLDEKTKLCSLHNDAKPYGGEMHKCWEEDKHEIPSFTREFLIEELGWDGNTDESDDDFTSDE